MAFSRADEGGHTEDHNRVAGVMAMDATTSKARQEEEGNATAYLIAHRAHLITCSADMHVIGQAAVYLTHKVIIQCRYTGMQQ